MTAAIAVPIVVVVIVQVPMLLYGLTRLRTAFRLRQNDPADIQTVRTASDGMVEFTGTAAELSGTVEGKYSGEKCLAYGWERKETQPNGTYAPTDDGAEGEPFLVRDETGEIAVDPAGTLKYGDPETWQPEPDVKQVEERIEAGDQVHVYGRKQDVVERQAGLDTESIYIGSDTHEMDRLEKIRARPHLLFGHVLGLSSDLHITLGGESDAVKRFGIIGGLFTVLGLLGVVVLGLLLSVWLA
jgi:hypothetical protein